MQRSRYSQRDLVGRQIGVVCAELDYLGFRFADRYVREQSGKRDYGGAHWERYYCGVEDGIDVDHSSLQICKQASSAASTTSAMITASTVARSSCSGLGIGRPSVSTSPPGMVDDGSYRLHGNSRLSISSRLVSLTLVRFWFLMHASIARRMRSDAFCLEPRL